MRDGVVRIDGEVERRSAVPGIVWAIRGVDGVVAVDDGLRWKDDDTEDDARR